MSKNVVTAAGCKGMNNVGTSNVDQFLHWTSNQQDVLQLVYLSTSAVSSVCVQLVCRYLNVNLTNQHGRNKRRSLCPIGTNYGHRQ